MSKIKLLFGIVFFAGIFFCSHETAGQQEEGYVSAYYFHGNFRCSNCYKIETYSKEAIEKFFKDELDSGRLIFKAVNVDEKGNGHFVYDYQLYTKSLVISLVKNGEEVKYQNLTKVWEYLLDKEKFYEYVRDEITKYLEEL